MLSSSLLHPLVTTLQLHRQACLTSNLGPVLRPTLFALAEAIDRLPVIVPACRLDDPHDSQDWVDECLQYPTLLIITDYPPMPSPILRFTLRLLLEHRRLGCTFFPETMPILIVSPDQTAQLSPISCLAFTAA